MCDLCPRLSYTVTCVSRTGRSMCWRKYGGTQPCANTCSNTCSTRVVAAPVETAPFNSGVSRIQPGLQPRCKKGITEPAGPHVPPCLTLPGTLSI